MTDKSFLAWVRTLPSCLSGTYSEYVHGEGRNPACHVRRAATSGTAIKPAFSAVPLTHREHLIQSTRGERALLLSVGWDVTVEEAKEWFDGQARKYRETWEAKETA